MANKFRVVYEWLQRLVGGNVSSQEPSQRSQVKKFDIVNVTQHTPPVQPTRTSRTGKFANITQTRPKKCPLCHTSTSGNITKLDNGSWKCKACGHTWRG